MGIPRFFYYCYQNFETSVQAISTKTEHSSEFIHFDLNAVIHPVCQSIFSYGSSSSDSLLYKKKPVRVTQEKIKEVYTKVCEVIETYVNLVKPTKGIFIAIDGVAGMSKCTQQRQRRFRNIKEKDNNVFDSNCISTGTVFMDRLSKHIDSFIKQKLNKGDWKDLEIIFSNEKIVGEGEHKILDHIRLNTELTTTVVSPDADLFMLLLGNVDFQTERKMYIMRENIYTNVECKYFVVDVFNLSKQIIKKITNTEKYDVHIIKDFIFYCFFLGNDFLPNIPCVDLSNKGLDLLFTAYANIMKEGFLIDYKNNQINKKSFVNMLKTIQGEEEKMLSIKFKSNKSSSDPYLAKCLLDQDGDMFDMDQYRKLYYKHKLDKNDNETIELLCEDYIRGMEFVLKYYIDSIPSYSWFYNHHYSPFSGDIAKYVEQKYKPTSFKKDKPMASLLQLMCILPPSSKNLLPSCVQSYYDSKNEKDNPIHKYVNGKVEVDYDFKTHEWEGVLKLPFINKDKFVEVFNKEYGKLTDIEKIRNSKGKLFVYYTDKNQKTGELECVIELIDME